VTLTDVRRLVVRTGARVRFQLPAGVECVLDEHGVAHIPALKAPPAFRLEHEFESVDRFVVETLAGKETRRESYSREQLMALTGKPAETPHAHDDE
jgi:hypothetical protein